MKHYLALEFRTINDTVNNFKTITIALSVAFEGCHAAHTQWKRQQTQPAAGAVDKPTGGYCIAVARERRQSKGKKTRIGAMMVLIGMRGLSLIRRRCGVGVGVGVGILRSDSEPESRKIRRLSAESAIYEISDIKR